MDILDEEIDDQETEMDIISNLQTDVNIYRKYGRKAELNYLKASIGNKMQQMKNIICQKKYTNPAQAEEEKSFSMKPSSAVIYNPEISLAELTRASQRLSEKKERVLQDAKNILTILEMTTSNKNKILPK